MRFSPWLLLTRTILFFFFFKQKTAYEIRPRDWSSDVCSSDLNTSGTGVGFTRNPSTGEKEFYGEFLINAQGEDVVAGIRTPTPIRELERVMPQCYKQLREITDRLEKHYRAMQDFEFTIQA